MTSEAPSYRVIEAVAGREGVSPTELSPPLSRVVDPDALDALVPADDGTTSGNVTVEFTYLDYLVRIRGGAEVTVSVRDRDGADGPESPPDGTE